MNTPRFVPNDRPTLGVELEFALVDSATMALSSAYDAVASRVPEPYRASVKPELMQCYLEVNTGICDTVDDVAADLTPKIAVVTDAARSVGVEILWTGTHPFSLWHTQEITPDDRYQGLVELLQDTARRLVTFGLHVHVGLDSGDKAVMIADRLLRHLPALLALSANSPFWNGRDTGLQSQRSKVMADLPTAGLPPLMRNWSEYVWLLRHMVETGFIQTIREVWWDVRPHHNFGTIEVRICDMPADLPTVLSLTALIQCLVHSLSDEIDRGTYQYDCHPMMVRLNKWRACRHGLAAVLVDPYTQEARPAADVIARLAATLRETAVELRCEPHLARLDELVRRGTGADHQRRLAADCRGNLAAVVRRLVAANSR
jgi:carboxylate-amine ligase